MAVKFDPILGELREADGSAYTLPTASDSVKGGIKIGSRLTMTGEVLSADVQTTDISGKVDKNTAITAGIKTKITYDTKGLITGGDDATTADIDESTDKKYVTDAEKTKLSNLSGTNTGDQIVPVNEAGASNNFLTAYNSSTGAWTKARPTWANIDKTTSSLADITTKSHTSLTDIGTNTHADIDTALTRLANTSGTNTGDQNLTGYALLAGRAGGQYLIGGTAANDDLTLEGTSNATRTSSYVILQPTAGNVGIGTSTPTQLLHLSASTPTLKFTTTRSTGTGVAWEIIDAGISNQNGTVAWFKLGALGNVSTAFSYAYMGNAYNDTWQTWNSTDVVVNANSSAINFKVNTAVLANAFVVNGTTGYTGMGTASPISKLHLTGGITAAAWGLNGIQTLFAASTYTDSSTAEGGTVTNAVANSIGNPTFASTNLTTTITNAATFYINNAPVAGTNVTITNRYAMWIDNGNLRLDGSLNLASAGGGNIITDTTTGTKIGTATTEKIGFHNATPVIQRAGAAQVAVATTGATNTTPYGYTTAAQADAIVTLVNEIRATLVEKGLMKGAA